MASIGRNQQCPCGSGKKYKKCHGASSGTPAATTPPSIQPALVQDARRFLASPTNRPGCYDAPEFLELERRDGNIIEEYARYVLTRKRTDDEDHRTRAVVGKLSAALTHHATESELRAKCGRITHAALRMLEQAGIWCFAVRGSAKFVFDGKTNLDTVYFWTQDQIDSPGGMASHAWLVVPPFHIADFTAGAQQWQNAEGGYVPRVVLSDSALAQSPDLTLIGAPHIAGLPRTQADVAASPLGPFLSWLPTRKVITAKVTVTYQPNGVTVPTERTLDEMKFRLAGRPLQDFWDDLVVAKAPT